MLDRKGACGARSLLFMMILAIGGSSPLCPRLLAQNELTDIPVPDPEAERAAMVLADSAAVNLYASDPDIRKPIQINFDAAGALWVASSEVYPQIQPGEKADDKIVVLRDTTGDGRADSQTVFAEGLLIPTGIAPVGTNGCYVAESTRLLLLEDTNGDGRSDSRRVVLSGFGTEDTHHLLHTLRWGPDGCLYFNQSIYIHSHIETADGTRRLDGGGIWRYRPSTGELEVFCRGFVNPWGHVFDELGESFVTDGAFFEGINYAFPGAVFVTSPDATRWLKGLNPGSPKHCGLEVLSGTHIPPSWNGDLVTNDFRSHRVCRFTLQPNGSGYVSRQQPEILTTNHVAFRPIDARMGPDGGLYIADWYNPIIQHGEVDFRDPRRDREHGRIWRVSFPQRPLDPWPDFASAAIDELVGMLERPALAIRQFAREELWRRGEFDPDAVINATRTWRDQQGLSDETRATRALELLWILEALRVPSPADGQVALQAGDRSDGRTLRPAIRSLWRSQLQSSQARQAIEPLVVRRVTDADPRARLEAVVSNAELRDPVAAGRTLDAAAMPMDDNLDFAIWKALRDQQQAWVAAAIKGEIDWSGKEASLAFAVAAASQPPAAEVAVRLIEQGEVDTAAFPEVVTAVAESGTPAQLGRMARKLFAGKVSEMTPRYLEALVARTERDKTIPEEAEVLLLELVPDAALLRDNPELCDAVCRAASAWQIERLEPVLSEALAIAPTSLQSELVAAIGSFRTATATATIDRLTSHTDPDIRVAAVTSLLQTRPRAAIGPLVKLLEDPQCSAPAAELVASLLQRRDVPQWLASELAERSLPADVSRQLLRRVRSAGGHESLEKAVREAGKLADAAWKLTPELSRRLLTAARETGSPQRGEVIYRRQELQCIVCHAIGPAGGLVGPNLISLGGSAQPDYILESLLDPSAKLKEGYTTRTVLTEEGQIINGIVIGQSDQTLRMRLADGKQVEIEIESIEEDSQGKSLMPAGLLDGLTEGELVDLVAFLAALGRTAEFSLSTEPIVRELETLVYSPQANRRLNRTSTDTAATDDPALEWRPLTTRVSGEIPLQELDRFQQHRATSPTSFLRFRFRMPAAGTAVIRLPGEHVESWVNGKPTPAWDLQSLALEAGIHQLVLAIDRSLRTEPFTIQIGGDAVPDLATD